MNYLHLIKYYFILTLLLVVNKIDAQQNNNLNNVFIKLETQINELKKTNSDSALLLIEQLILLSKKDKTRKFEVKALHTKAMFYISNGNYDKAEKIVNQAGIISSSIDDDNGIANNVYQKGLIASGISNDVKKTFEYVHQALNLSIACKDSSLYREICRQLSKVYGVQEQLELSHEFALKSIPVINSHTIPKELALSYFSIADSYWRQSNIDSSEKYYSMAYEICMKNNLRFTMAWVLCNWAIIYGDIDPIKTLVMQLQAQKIFNEQWVESTFSASNLGNIGETYLWIVQNDSLIKQLKNTKVPKNKSALLKEAEKHVKEAIYYSIKSKNFYTQIYETGILADIQALQGNYKGAYYNSLSKFTLNDSIFSQKNKNAIAKLESQKKVIELETNNVRKTESINMLVLGLASICIISILILKNNKHKQKVQQQKIIALEKDKQYNAIDNLLQGQETERTRIAQELHDGLGGMLGGVKMSLNNMKENLIMTPENLNIFNKSIVQLDETLKELRKVSHNLMPDVLVRFGLIDALKDYCNSIETNSDKNISFQQIGTLRTFNNSIQLNIYRVIQELTNNAVKHSEAKQILVQLAIEEAKVLITVEDDGKGFDTNLLAENFGMGISSIKHRIAYLKGTMEIDSKINYGTSINIELNI